MLACSLHACFVFQPHIRFPSGVTANEEMVLRWVHFVAGITWIGLLYFFNLIAGPVMKGLGDPVRGKVFPALMSRAMVWFRWSALVTVLAGLRYYWLVLKADAANAGEPSLARHWLGWWFVIWLVAYAVLYALQVPMKGFLDKGWVRSIPIAVVVVIASRVSLEANAGPQSSNSHLSISIGGGLGLVLLLNVWGIVWRAQKRLIEWTGDHAEHGAPMPAEAARLARWAFIASRTGFWLSFPMLFFMGAANHYPFLSSITD